MTDRDTIDTWLKALETALAAVPEGQRADVVAEARSHLEERLAAGLSADSALHGFGSAKAYGQGFVDQHALDTALNSKRTIVMITTLAGFTSRSIIAISGLLCALVFGAIAIGGVISIVMELIDPSLVGFWIWEGPNNHTRYTLGTPMDRTGAIDIAGAWIYPLLLGMVVIGGLLARGSLVAAIRSIKGQMPITG